MYASLNWVIIGSGNGLSLIRRQVITWTNVDVLLIGLQWNFNQNSNIKKKIHLKWSSTKWCPFCLGLSVLVFIFWIVLMKYICICCHFSVSSWCRCLKFFFMKDKDPFIQLNWYYGCWWPGNAGSQGICSHGIWPSSPELFQPQHQKG